MNFILSKQVLNRFQLQTEEEIEEFLSLVPNIQLKNGILIMNQPFKTKVVKSPIRSADIEKRTMGIDLGLKHYATISIMNEQNHEIARYFLNDKSIFAMRFSTATGHFEKIRRPHEQQIIEKIKNKGNDPQTKIQRYAEGWNIKNELKHITETIGNLQSLKAKAVKNKNKMKEQQYQDQISLAWNKVHNIHGEIVHKLSHTILEIAKYHNVSGINFENLKWSRSSGKKKVGVWLSHKQVHWFFSKIIEHVKQSAEREGFVCNLVNAAYTSKICSECIKTNAYFRRFQKQSLTRPELKILVSNNKWNRNGKQFTCGIHYHADKESKKHIDADLNAARNIAMLQAK